LLLDIFIYNIYYIINFRCYFVECGPPETVMLSMQGSLPTSGWRSRTG